jgi:hypothetical protein
MISPATAERSVGAMFSLSNNTETSVESELVDITTHSLFDLRTLHSPALRTAIKHAVRRAGEVHVCDQSKDNNWAN